MKRTTDPVYTAEDLKAMQAWPLERKVNVSQLRILEWLVAYNGAVYVSFSGGKDSTVVADLTARVIKANFFDQPEKYPLRLTFVDTGLEYPEIRKFVPQFAEWLRKKYGIPVELNILRPEKKFPEVIEKYGYPIISKDVADGLERSQNGSKTVKAMFDGVNIDGSYSAFRQRYLKYAPLKAAPFKISGKCCYHLKEAPIRKHEKEKRLRAITGMMASESQRRKTHYLVNGCNSFGIKRQKSMPLGFWTEQDVLQYIQRFSLPIAEIYGEIGTVVVGRGKAKKEILKCSGAQRTGCMFCMFGAQCRGDDRFRRMAKTHPKQYDYCINKLGLGKVLEYIGVDYSPYPEEA